MSEGGEYRWEFPRGESVWYRQTCKGGYGFQRDIDAEVVGPVTPKRRISIRVYPIGADPKIISVAVHNVRRRT